MDEEVTLTVIARSPKDDEAIPCGLLIVHLAQFSTIVIPAKAEIQCDVDWTPAFAGVTAR
jgi:hypothetical protein